jgi:hypothetical protein
VKINAEASQSDSSALVVVRATTYGDEADQAASEEKNWTMARKATPSASKTVRTAEAAPSGLEIR